MATKSEALLVGDCGGAKDQSRRHVLTTALSLSISAVLGEASAAAATSSSDARLKQAFLDAMAVRNDPEEADRAWTKAIEVAPDNSAAWSNRGTVRLQFGRWELAREDLEYAYKLEAKRYNGDVSPVLLNNLGNAEGAVGEWESAMFHYKAAAADPSGALQSIAMANYALAAFEIGRNQEAIKEVQQLLRRDPNFLDARCALAAFLWGSGREADAETAWNELQQSQDGIGGDLYSRSSAVSVVRPRWPPRATAALSAFINLERSGRAEGYDGQWRDYTF